MTVTQLKRRLDKLIAAGQGRRKVVVDITSFPNPLDGTHLDVDGLGPETVHASDEDGGTATNKDGSERHVNVLTLVGAGGADMKGNLVERSLR